MNAGWVLDWHAGAKDLDGNARAFSRAVDLGCYESPYGSGMIFILR